MIPLHGKCEHGRKPSDCYSCLKDWAEHMEHQREIDEHFAVLRVMSALPASERETLGYYPSRGVS